MTVRPGDVPINPREPSANDRERNDGAPESMEASWEALKQEIGQFAEDSRAVVDLETRLFLRNSLGLAVVAILLATLLATSWAMLLTALVVWVHTAFDVPLALVLALGGIVGLLAIFASIPLLKSLVRGLGFHETRVLLGNTLQTFTGRGEPR